MHFPARTALVIGISLLGACTVGTNYRRPEINLTPAYVGAAGLSTAPQADDGTWWIRFEDPILNELVERALSQNLDLAVAAGRVRQARAAAQLAGASLQPRLDAEAGASSVRQSLNSPIGEIARAAGAPRHYEVYTVGTEASWELDWFGGLRRAREAAIAEAQVAEVAAVAVRISVASEVGDAYLALRGLQARATTAESQLRIQASLVDLVRQRVGQGVASDRELNRVIGEFERVASIIPPLQIQIDGQLNRIDVLTGEQAGRHRALLLVRKPQPSAPLPAAGNAPAELLRRRPDVVAAEQRLIAASARVGAALAEYYPHLSLDGLLGLADVGTGTLLSNGAMQAEATVGLRWRLFDFGRIDAEVAGARGREAQALAEYRSSVLRATEDVENALSAFIQSGIEERTLERQVAALTTARDQTEDAYENGVLSLIDVLDADRELLAASDRLVIVKTEQGRASVASYRALGGGWAG